MKRPAALLAAFLALAAPAAAQVVVSSLVGEGGVLMESADLQLVRYGALAPADGPVAVGVELAGGDLLSSGRATAGIHRAEETTGARSPGSDTTPAPGPLRVELSCPGGSRLRFAGPFRVQILAPRSGGGCAVELLAGEMEVVAEGGTEVRSGGLTVEGTGVRYALRVEEGAEAGAAVRQQVRGLDGAVRVATLGGEARVGAGRVLTVEAPRGRPELAVMTEGPLEAGEVERVAGLGAPLESAPGEPTEAPADRPVVPSVPLAAAAEPPATDAPQAPPAGPEPAAGASEPTSVPAPRAEPATSASEPASATPAEPPSTTPAEPPPAPSPPPPDREELRRWLEEERYGEVIRSLEPRLSGGGVTSVDYFLVAQAYAGLGRWDRASSYAGRALRLDEVDDQLTSRELAAAQNLQHR